MWWPYLALAAAFVPLLLMGIGYLLMGTTREEAGPGEHESRTRRVSTP